LAKHCHLLEARQTEILQAGPSISAGRLLLGIVLIRPDVADGREADMTSAGRTALFSFFSEVSDSVPCEARSQLTVVEHAYPCSTKSPHFTRSILLFRKRKST
jgi:hypothetical protein